MDGVTLITGSTGFVGRQVTKLLLRDKGNKIRIAVRRRSEIVDQLIDGGCDVVYTDNVFDLSEECAKRLPEDVSQVIHLAWYADPSDYLISDANFECLKGTVRLAKLAKIAGIKKFIGIGTCLEYASSNEPLSVQSKLAADSPYAIAKLAAYLLLTSCFADTEVQFCWCRLFFLYGEGEDERRLTPYINRQLAADLPVNLGDPDAARDFMDIETAAGHIVGVSNGEAVGAFNICTGQRQTIREYSTNIAKRHGKVHLLGFGHQLTSTPTSQNIVGVPLQGTLETYTVK